MMFTLMSNLCAFISANDIPKCRYGDGECIARIMNDFVRQTPAG